VLCVDDEPEVLAGLALHLRRHYDVHLAPGGAEALALLARPCAVAVILSDMRMPGMDGARFLVRAQAIAPDATRLLLTGHADLDSAIAAVNDGHVFRFLTKPCPPPQLLGAMDAAAAQYRLVTAERELLEQTLHGSLKALTDVLALTSPLSFGRATRVKELASRLADQIGLPDTWQIGVAAMLAPLGCIMLPDGTAENAYYDRPLTIDEQTLLRRVPAITEQLLANIPRLEVVRAIIAAAPAPFSASAGAADAVARAGQVLRVATDLDRLEAQGHAADVAVSMMRQRIGRYDPALLDLVDVLNGTAVPMEVVELPLSALTPGMVFAEDVRLSTGTLLAARGYIVSATFVASAQNFRSGLDRSTVAVTVPAADRGHQ
jgi:CheY-like chemotaxis protein